MYRFKVSKYKNAAPRVPKKEVRADLWFHNLYLLLC